MASALYFSGDGTAALLISADVIGFRADFVDDLRAKISSKTGIPSGNIMLTAVHNHGGPAVKADEDEVPSPNEEYIKVLKDKLLALSIEASTKGVPCRMGIGKGTCNLNINRRAVFADGGVWLGRNPDGPCDHEVGVVITAGASGDINPIYGPGVDFDEIEAVGFHVGSAALKALSQVEFFPMHSLQAVNASLTLPGKKACPDRFPRSYYEEGPGVEVRLTALRIGGLVLCGVSGELMTEIGLEVKKRSPYSGTFIITHCNGSSGYICMDKAFADGGYEVQVTRLMPGAEIPLTRKFLELIRSF